MKRSELITILVCLSLVTIQGPIAAADDLAADDKPVVTARSADGKINIEIDGELFTSFRYTDTPKAFLYPVIGPSGAMMTRGFPIRDDLPNENRDHPHHRSFWFGHGNIAGVDFWHEGGAKDGEIKTTSIVTADLNFIRNEAEQSGINITGLKPQSPIIRHDESWFKRGEEAKPILRSRSYYAFESLGDASRAVDIIRSHSLPNGMEQVTFGDTKEGTMAIRSHPALRLKGKVATGKAINSNGDTGGKVWGKRAKWVAYWGEIDGETCGFAIFDHPTNLRHPTWWHARDYGLVAANPFGISDFERGKHDRGAGDYTLKQGETLDLRYRFVFFAGTAEQAKIAEQYDQWVRQTSNQPDPVPAADSE